MWQAARSRFVLNLGSSISYATKVGGDAVLCLGNGSVLFAEAVTRKLRAGAAWAEVARRVLSSRVPIC
jgi:hypothetical protein